jgi:hypothetical protein
LCLLLRWINLKTNVCFLSDGRQGDWYPRAYPEAPRRHRLYA